jgi:peptide/nickel transport system substrate-binding protein
MLSPGPRPWRPRRTLAAFSLAGAVALVLTACGSSGSGGTASASSASGGTLYLADAQIAPNSYNPWSAGYGINNTLWFSQALYDSLVTLNANAQPQPSLATSWQQSANSITLHLRTGVKFSDGTPLNAAAVAANLRYAAATPAGNECNAYLAGLKVTVLNSTTVKLATPKPFPGLLTDLGQCAGFIVSPKALAKPGSLVSRPDGSGPYTLDQAATITGQKYTFVKNPNYWNSSAFPYEKVVLTIYNSIPPAVNAVRGGQGDVLSNLTENNVTGLGSSVGQLSGKPDLITGMWVADTTGALSKPLGNVLVREAMNYAIDRKAIVSGLYKSTGEVAGSTPFPAFYTGYSTSLANIYPYDPAKAKQLLTQAGYPQGFTVNVIAPTGLAQIVQAIAGYLAAVGIKLQIDSYGSNFVTEMLTGNFPLIVGDYTLNPAQYQTITGIVGPDGFWNPRHNTDVKVMQLLESIPTTPSAKLPAVYSQIAHQIATDGLLVAPVISDQITIYDPKAVKVKTVPGVPVPMLYDISK